AIGPKRSLALRRASSRPARHRPPRGCLSRSPAGLACLVLDLPAVYRVLGLSSSCDQGAGHSAASCFPSATPVESSPQQLEGIARRSFCPLRLPKRGLSVRVTCFVSAAARASTPKTEAERRGLDPAFEPGANSWRPSHHPPG